MGLEYLGGENGWRSFKDEPPQKHQRFMTYVKGEYQLFKCCSRKLDMASKYFFYENELGEQFDTNYFYDKTYLLIKE